MTGKKCSFNPLTGEITLPFRFEDLPEWMQELFSEPQPLPTYRLEDVKPWPKDISWKSLPGPLDEYNRMIEDNPKKEEVEDD